MQDEVKRAIIDLCGALSREAKVLPDLSKPAFALAIQPQPHAHNPLPLLIKEMQLRTRELIEAFFGRRRFDPRFSFGLQGRQPGQTNRRVRPTD